MSRREAGRADLLEALADLVDVDPEEYLPDGVRCHFCLAAGGRPHEDACPWVLAAVLVTGEPAVARRLVGEEPEDFEDRLEDEEDEPSDLRAFVAGAMADLRPPPGAEEVEDLPEAEPFAEPGRDGRQSESAT